MIEVVRKTVERSRWKISDILKVLGVSRSTYYEWIQKKDGSDVPGKPVTNPYSILQEERRAVILYALQHPDMRHREIAWKMVDEDVAYLSPTTVYKILKEENLIKRWGRKKEREKREGRRPMGPDEKWQSDISYVKIGRRYYFISFIDEYSRYLTHHDLMVSMDGDSVSLAAQEALEKLPPGKNPIIQTDNGSGYISRDFKIVLSQRGIGHHRIHPHCSQGEWYCGKGIQEGPYWILSTKSSRRITTRQERSSPG